MVTVHAGNWEEMFEVAGRMTTATGVGGVIRLGLKARGREEDGLMKMVCWKLLE